MSKRPHRIALAKHSQLIYNVKDKYDHNAKKNSPQRFEKLKIKGLALNSQDVKKGFIFFAIKGNKSNGENYINQAIKNGATIIICSKGCKFQSTKVNVIKSKKVRN